VPPKLGCLETKGYLKAIRLVTFFRNFVWTLLIETYSMQACRTLYVDDIRLFCPTKLDARRSIRRLSALLYFKGLNLQSAKTEICDKTQSRQRIDGVTEIIHNLNRKLARELTKAVAGILNLKRF
jgi:hypothetical protein